LFFIVGADLNVNVPLFAGRVVDPQGALKLDFHGGVQAHAGPHEPSVSAAFESDLQPTEADIAANLVEVEPDRAAVVRVDKAGEEPRLGLEVVEEAVATSESELKAGVDPCDALGYDAASPSFSLPCRGHDTANLKHWQGIQNSLLEQREAEYSQKATGHSKTGENEIANK
jgi:hypothetical protein